MIAIVDFGVGNLRSISNMLKKAGYDSEITNDADRIASAGKIILPGVGAFDTAMIHLIDTPLRDALENAVIERKVPLLGICLGMQLLTSGSEEGRLPGLGWIDGRCKKLQPIDGLKVPQMQWNSVHVKTKHPLTEQLGEAARFYFVHSYYAEIFDQRDILLTSHHGLPIASAVARANIMGVQFHPERSHKFGCRLLKNFAAL